METATRKFSKSNSLAPLPRSAENVTKVVVATSSEGSRTIVLLAVVMYYIYTYTGSNQGSATDADIYVNLVGELGDTGSRHMLRSNNHVKFQQGQVERLLLLVHVSQKFTVSQLTLLLMVIAGIMLIYSFYYAGRVQRKA